MVSWAIRDRQAFPFIAFIVFTVWQDLAVLRQRVLLWASIQTWAHVQQPVCRGWVVESLWAKRVFHIVGI